MSKTPTDAELGWREISREPAGDHRIFTVERSIAQSPVDGQSRTFHRIQSQNWTQIVPITADGHIVLIRQYRHGAQRVTLEIPGGLVDPGEEAVGRELALIGLDRCAEAQHACRIICCRVVVGYRPAEGAHVAHHRVADLGGQMSQRGNRLQHILGRGNLGVSRHRADRDAGAVHLDPAQLRDSAQVDQVRRRREAQLHCRNQRLAAGQQPRLAVRRELAGCVGDAGGLVVVELVHESSGRIYLVMVWAAACTALTMP